MWPEREEQPEGLPCPNARHPQATRLGQLLNNFLWFYWSHQVGAAVLVLALLLHPYPGLPGRQHEHGHSVTWVCAPTTQATF